jgi:hypothetical protein
MRLTEAAKALATRDHVRGISGLSALSNNDAVNHEAHNEAPEDHIAINLRAALIVARDYYTKLDDSLAYYAATILYPRYKGFCDAVWSSNWLATNNRNFQSLWAEYRTMLKP